MQVTDSTRLMIRDFRPSDVKQMTVQEAQLGDYAIIGSMTDDDWAKAGSLGVARTACKGSTVYGCAGLMKVWDGRAIAWALLSNRVHRYHLLFITRWIMCFLDWCGEDMNLRRIETPVRCDFPQAARWAEMLGFEQEGRMTYYCPDGTSSFLYARTR